MKGSNKLEDEKYLKEFEEIKNYYKNVFNIDIINVFINKNSLKEIKEIIKPIGDVFTVKDAYNKFEKTISIHFIIYIKDNNKTLFKNKIFYETIEITSSYLIDNKTKILEYKLIERLKTKMENYCINNYVNKLKTANELNKLNEKDKKFIKTYNEYLNINNYLNKNENNNNDFKNSF